MLSVKGHSPGPSADTDGGKHRAVADLNLDHFIINQQSHPDMSPIIGHSGGSTTDILKELQLPVADPQPAQVVGGGMGDPHMLAVEAAAKERKKVGI